MITKEQIGNCAGIIWRVLETEAGSMAVKDIAKYTSLSQNEVDMALGWLAREDKIEFCECCGEERVNLTQFEMYF